MYGQFEKFELEAIGTGKYDPMSEMNKNPHPKG